MSNKPTNKNASPVVVTKDQLNIDSTNAKKTKAKPDFTVGLNLQRTYEQTKGAKFIE